MQYWVYVLKNSLTDKIYIGQTSNLTIRINRHNKIMPSKSSSFTSRNKTKGIWQIIYTEEFDSRKQAIIREKELKSFRGRQFIKTKVRVASSVGRSASWRTLKRYYAILGLCFEK